MKYLSFLDFPHYTIGVLPFAFMFLGITHYLSEYKYLSHLGLGGIVCFLEKLHS